MKWLTVHSISITWIPLKSILAKMKDFKLLVGLLLSLLCFRVTAVFGPSTSISYSDAPLISSIFTSSCSNTSLVVWEDSGDIKYAVYSEKTDWTKGSLGLSSLCGVQLAALELSDLVILAICSDAAVETY